MPNKGQTSKLISLVALGLLILVLVPMVSPRPIIAGVGHSTRSPGASPSLASPQLDPTPGLDLQGHVWINRENGAGLGNVTIYQRYTPYYTAQVVATTAPDGYYQPDFAYIPGDEVVFVWAELEGYTMNPTEHSWMHYTGYESKELNFVAIPHIYLPVVFRSGENR